MFRGLILEGRDEVACDFVVAPDCRKDVGDDLSGLVGTVGECNHGGKEVDGTCCRLSQPENLD